MLHISTISISITLFVHHPISRSKYEEHVLYWITINKSGAHTCEQTTARCKHFKAINSNNPYLLGKNHNNRLKRGTKVLIVSGVHKNRHGIIVGHGEVFNILNDIPPKLKVLIATEEIIEVSQAIVRLVDLHNFIGYAIPSDFPFESKIHVKHTPSWGEPREKQTSRWGEPWPRTRSYSSWSETPRIEPTTSSKKARTGDLKQP